MGCTLLHSGFFKWRRNSAGTNGYVMVSASNERDVQLIQKINQQDIAIKYQPNAFNDDLARLHLFKWLYKSRLYGLFL